MDLDSVRAMALAKGSTNSHASILANSFGLASVVNLGDVFFNAVTNGTVVIVDGSFKSFFGLLKKSDYSSKVKLPKYLPKDGYATLVIGFVRLNGNKLRIPFSNLYRKRHKNIEITIPPVLLGKNVKEIRIIPKYNARFFEIQYTYEAECVSRNLNINNALAIDLGVNNLITAVTSSGNSFIIDGRRLKSINQEYNKTNSRLQSIKDKQGLGRRVTRRQNRITNKRNNRVNDYICKAARRVINYCISNDIGVLVVGMNKDFQRESDMGLVGQQHGSCRYQWWWHHRFQVFWIRWTK